MNTGDIIVWRDTSFGRHRFWQVEGIFLGAEGQEGVIELRSLTQTPATSYGGSQRHVTTFVPEPFLRGAEVYSRKADA